MRNKNQFGYGQMNTNAADTTFNCECLKCGYKTSGKTHCMSTKCPKCGGEMRRANRPGMGR